MLRITSFSLSRAVPLGAALALAAAVACSDTNESHAEPEVAFMRLTVGGTQTVTVDEFGTVTGGPITIPVGNTSLVAEWLRADGTEDPNVHEDDFELRVVPANTGIVTFTRTAAFEGTLNGLQTGSTSASFALFHIEEQHEDFGPFSVGVTVQ
jgi:hypothetical protein